MKSPQEPLPGELPPAGTVRSFEDFRLGETFESPPRTIEADHIRRFAELSGDFNPIHMDPAFARKTHFRGVVAHGMLLASLVTGLGYRSGLFGKNTLALESSQEEFLMPARPGDRFYVRGRSVGLEADVSKRCGRVRWEVDVLRKQDEGDDELIMRASWSTLIFKAPYLKRLRKA